MEKGLIKPKLALRLTNPVLRHRLSLPLKAAKIVYLKKLPLFFPDCVNPVI
jgi:hypothetical protein